MPTTPSTINYYIAADGTLRDGQAGSIAQTPRIYYGTEYAVTLSFPPSTIAEGDQLQVALNRTRTFFSSASATGDAPVAAVVKHDVTAEEAAAQAVTVVLPTNTRAMIDQVNGIDHPVRGFFGVHVLRGQSFVTLAVADALMMSLESGPDAISPSLPVVDYPTREEAEALAERSESAAERAEEAAAGIVPPLQLSSPPTTSTSGSVGQLAVWHDADNNKDHLYHLCFISTSDSATLYHWEECVLTSMGNVAGGYPVLDANGKIASAQLPPMDYIPTSEKGAANGVAGLDGDALVPSNQLPVATNSTLGVCRTDSTLGTTMNNGKIQVYQASDVNIDTRNNSYRPITSSKLNYAVTAAITDANRISLNDAQKAAAQSVFGVGGAVVTIPAATSEYTLSWGRFAHLPSLASVYVLPAVADGSITNDIVLSVKFSANVLTYEFQDSAGNTLVPLPLNGDIEAGSVVTFLCRYNPLLAQWVIYPVMDGKEAQA